MNCRLVKIQYILSYYRSWCVVWTQNINYYSDQPLHYETYHHHDHKLGTLGIRGADFTGESCGALIQYTIVQCEMLHMDSVKRHYGNISRNIVDSFSNANTRGPRTEITQRTLRLHTGAKEEEQEVVAFNIPSPRSSEIRRMFWNS